MEEVKDEGKVELAAVKEGRQELKVGHEPDSVGCGRAKARGNRAKAERELAEARRRPKQDQLKH